MSDLSFEDRQSSGLQALMHLGHTAMFPEAPWANEGNHVQTKLAVGERPPSFFFGVRAHMIARTRGGVALTDGYPELENPLQGHHLPPTVVGDPTARAAFGTRPLKQPRRWPQTVRRV